MANLQQFTIGVEEEYMILDPSSKELKSHQKTIVIEGEKKFKDKIKAEMHQAVVEVGASGRGDLTWTWMLGAVGSLY